MKTEVLHEKARKGKEGFTLIEVVVAAVIMAMVMGGAYALISQSGRMARTARDHYIAVALAQNRLERARNLEFSDLWLYEENNLVVDENGNPDPAGNYRRSTVVNTNYGVGVSEITVNVDIRNFRTGAFDFASESVASLMTEYLDFN